MPGHELAGIVEETGGDVTRWKRGDRVTVPFVCGCGTCPECANGNHQVCDHQTQPGFTHWGSFAEYVAIDHADVNLVALPDEMDFVTAASLGCRFATSFRGRRRSGPGGTPASGWPIHGCGGVGLSALMIATRAGRQGHRRGHRPDKSWSWQLSSVRRRPSTRATPTTSPAAIHDLTGRGAHVSIDALGSPITCSNSILSLRKRGRHVQVGLLAGDDYRPRLPMERVIGWELEILGSHGMQAFRYGEMLDLITPASSSPNGSSARPYRSKKRRPELEAMGDFGAVGITVIDRF